MGRATACAVGRLVAQKGAIEAAGVAAAAVAAEAAAPEAEAEVEA